VPGKDLSASENAARTPRTSQRQIAEKRRVPKSIRPDEENVSRETFSSNRTSGRKRKREGEDPGNDEASSEWVSSITNRGVRVSGPVLKTEAKELAKKTGDEHFIAADGRLSGRKNRHETHFFFLIEIFSLLISVFMGDRVTGPNVPASSGVR